MATPASAIATRLDDLETPCLVADRARIEANAGRMRDRASTHGVALRPHLKTLKSADAAVIAHGGRAGPVTVSTLREAEYFLAHGFADLTYAVCIAPNKFAHAADLVRRGADLKLLVASPGVAGELAAYADRAGVHFRVMIEIDSGEHRTGLAPDDPALIDTAKCLAAVGLTPEGLLTHGGHSYRCRSREAIAEVAEQERTSLLEARDRLAAAGVDVRAISSGSTPTATHGKRYDGITEIRPGVYLAGDLYQAQLETCRIADIAVSVLAAVIAHDRPRNRLVIDAGGLALSKDRSTANAPVDYGYGLVVRADGSRWDDDPVVSAVSQEHGEVTSAAPLPFDELPLGSLVRVLPNHACMTAAAYDRYHVVDGGTRLVDLWDKVAGW